MTTPLIYAGLLPCYNTGFLEALKLTSGILEQVQEPGDGEIYACEDEDNNGTTVGDDRKSLARVNILDSHGQELGRGRTSQNSSNLNQQGVQGQESICKSQIVPIPATPRTSESDTADEAKKPPVQSHARTSRQTKKKTGLEESHVRKEEPTKKQTQQKYVRRTIRSSRDVDLSGLCGHFFCTSCVFFNHVYDP